MDVWAPSRLVGEGLSGYCLIWASSMLPPKLGHILGCLALTEYFFCQKKNPTQVKSLFKNTMENPFFDFFQYWPKLFNYKIWNRNMDIFISNLLSESIFDFGKWSNGKYTNTRICVFSVWPLPKVKNWFRKQIWNENVHISILNFF